MILLRTTPTLEPIATALCKAVLRSSSCQFSSSLNLDPLHSTLRVTIIDRRRLGRLPMVAAWRKVSPLCKGERRKGEEAEAGREE